MVPTFGTEVCETKLPIGTAPSLVGTRKRSSMAHAAVVEWELCPYINLFVSIGSFL